MKKALFAAACTVVCCLADPLPAQAKGARVCTRNYDGYLNVRSAPDTRAKIIGRRNNDQYVWFSGGFHRGRDGHMWHQMSSGGWLRGDYLCFY